MNKKFPTAAVSLITFAFFTILIGFSSSFLPNALAKNQIENLLKEDDLSELTIKIASSTARFPKGKPSENKRLENSIAKLAEKRYAKLVDLIETDAAEVLRVALPENVLSKMPLELQNNIEKREQKEGELEIVSECDDHDGQILYYLNSGKERLSLHFAEQPDEELFTGARLNVRGVRIGDTIAVSESKKSDSLQSSATALPNTFGEQKTLVLLVNFQNDQREPFTAAQINSLVFNDVSNYYREASYQQTWLTGDTRGWYTLPINSGDCDGSTTAYYAKQAAVNAGVNLSAYDKFVYFYPTMAACSYGGKATIGGNEAWINGYYSLRTFAHEIGHNFGLYHARALDCDSSAIGNTCSTIEYGNSVDMMGLPSVTGNFHAYQKERLGWLSYGSSPAVTTVQTSGTYTISPYSAFDFAPKALKILKSVDSAGKQTWYYVEFRRPIGFDGFISGNSNLMNGVLVTMDKDSNGQENYLLDMTPETSSWNDPALVVNRSFSDSSAGVTITPLSVDNNGATVNINFGGVSCVKANPSISVSPSETKWIGAGNSASYTVTVTNNDNSGCAAAGFNFQSTLPGGWNAVFASPVLNINPGTAASTTVQVSSANSTADGFYSVGIRTSNAAASSYSTAASLNFAIYSSFDVSASPSQSSYTRTQMVSVTASVTANGSKMAGANVTFTMTKADGSIVKDYATSAADGSALFSYRFNKKRDPVGTYIVSVDAAMNGVSGSNSTNFQVK